MQITIDDESKFALKSNPKTVGDALLEITQHVQTQNRVVQSISLDGKNIAPDELTLELGNTPVSNTQSLKVETADMKELIISNLDEIAQVIPELPIACHELAQALTGDSPATAFAQFNQFLDIWEVLKERQTQVINLLEENTASIKIGSTSVATHNATLDNLIQRARKYMESSSFPELSDLLSHDLVDLAEVEEEIIAQLKAKL